MKRNVGGFHPSTPYYEHHHFSSSIFQRRGRVPRVNHTCRARGNTSVEKRSGRQRYSTRDERVHLYVGKKLFVFSPFRKCTYRYVTRYNYTCNSSISNFQDRGCSRIKITRGASAKDNDAARREVPKVLVARRETERWREGGSSARFQLYSSPRLSLPPPPPKACPFPQHRSNNKDFLFTPPDPIDDRFS